jgi:hypothetical protein
MVGRPGLECQAKVYEGFMTATAPLGLCKSLSFLSSVLLCVFAVGTGAARALYPCCWCAGRAVPATGRQVKDRGGVEALGGKGTLKRSRQVCVLASGMLYVVYGGSESLCVSVLYVPAFVNVFVSL